MSSTRYTHPRPAANSISEIILETLQTIEQGTGVQLTSAQARFPSDKVQGQLLYHFDIGNVLVSNITVNDDKKYRLILQMTNAAIVIVILLILINNRCMR